MLLEIRVSVASKITPAGLMLQAIVKLPELVPALDPSKVVKLPSVSRKNAVKHIVRVEVRTHDRAHRLLPSR